jgi:radical SAM protein (TIGR01212 family)
MKFPISLQTQWRGRRYNSYNRVLKDTFCARVYKVGLRMDFTCPNRDGSLAVGGCIYCNNASHTPETYRARMSVTAQLAQGTVALRQRHRADKFIAYFQSYTNTYDSVSKLETLFREALEFPGIVGLSIATRPDCLPDDVLDLLSDLARETYLWLELGLESIEDRTLRWVNRGHGVQEFVEAVERSKRRDLRVCAHLILGFPGESRADILRAPLLLNGLGIDGVKLHNLHVIRHTVLEKLYAAGKFELLPQEDYVSWLIDFLELLTPQMIIHRLTGETYRAITVAPEWSVNKIGVINAIDKELLRRDTWQGRSFRPPLAKPVETASDVGQGVER